MHELNKHKIRPEKSNQAIGPELQVTFSHLFYARFLTFSRRISDLVTNDKCPGLEGEVDNRLARITEQWEFLVQKSTEKNLKLKEASRQQTFNAGVKDIEFWLGLVENQLQNEEYGRDLASVQNLLKKHQLIEADIQSHAEQIKELNTTAGQFIANDLFDTEAITGTISAINSRSDEVKI